MAFRTNLGSPSLWFWDSEAHKAHVPARAGLETDGTCLRDKKMSFYDVLMCSVYKQLSSVIYFVYPGLITKKILKSLRREYLLL